MGVHCAPYTTVHSSLSGVILSACLTSLGLRSDLTAWSLGELQSWSGCVGNQQCVGLESRGGWRGRGYDFPGMEPVQDCD